MNTERTDFQARTVRCPACGGASVYAPTNVHRPFCSERCKHHDFGAWASESFKVEERGANNPSEFLGQH
ncbi:MAG: DNA gyrase inhibitor YacG [Comamonadaceae bacterium]|nr:DNA gyrase inhibitor YacG [Comamonadaceae bacterium]